MAKKKKYEKWATREADVIKKENEGVHFQIASLDRLLLVQMKLPQIYA